jgi:polysaccharide export outer membrane protein
VDGKTRIIPVKMEDILTDGKLTTNIDLSPGDVVTVPERLF